MYVLKDHKKHACELKDRKIINESCAGFEKQNLPKRNDAIVQPIVEDPIDDERISEAKARMIPAFCETSESGKMKYELTHISFQPWCTSCVKKKPS